MSKVLAVKQQFEHGWHLLKELWFVVTNGLQHAILGYQLLIEVPWIRNWQVMRVFDLDGLEASLELGIQEDKLLKLFLEYSGVLILLDD